MQIAEGVGPVREATGKRPFDWAAIANSGAFLPAVLITVGLFAIFWGLFAFTYGKWIGSEGYYSHGFLVPPISGYIVYRWWPKLRALPVKAGWAGVPFLAGMLWIAYAANRTDIYTLLSIAFLVILILSAWVIAGWRWMLALAAPILYLAFALPIWDQVIQNYTNPLQLVSTKVSFYLLRLMGMHPLQLDPTNIQLSNYRLEVAVACSGLKLLLALGAFATFFMLIAKLKPWANLLFAASILPLGLFINGLRIALIGVVGNTWGEKAGASFHDYSGYIAIILCFFILSKWTRLLGWKDQPMAGEPAGKTEAALKSVRSRAFAVGAALLACGAIILAAPKPVAAAGRTEAWMEAKAPTKIDNYRTVSSYKMDKATYDELQPYGIVSRIFSDGVRSFDVTLVASNRKTSFHDPRVCFPAQGWSFETQQRIMVKTETRGTIPVTIVKMDGADAKNQFAAFFYRGNHGFYPTPQALSWSMFLDQFAGRTDSEGVFYRFMPGYDGATQDELVSFIRRYMDEAPKTSGGFF